MLKKRSEINIPERKRNKEELLSSTWVCTFSGCFLIGCGACKTKTPAFLYSAIQECEVLPVQATEKVHILSNKFS